MRRSLRHRPQLLVVLMTSCVAIVAGLSMGLLYRAALDQQRARLVEVARNQAHLISAVARFDADQGHSLDDTLGQIEDAHERFEGFGETGEFTLAREENGQIVFLLAHRHGDLARPQPIALEAEVAEPMRRALQGKSGTLVGLDYRGAHVLAAHEPLPELGWGVVAKIDFTEIRAPFLRAGAIAALVAVVLVLLATILFMRLTNPLVSAIEQSEARYRRLVEYQQDMLLLLDPSLRVSFANPKSCEFMNLEGEALQGRTLASCLPIDDREALAAELAHALTPPHRFAYESCDEQGRVLAWSGGAVLDARGEVREVVVVGHDLTDQRRADDERLRMHKLESVGTLAGGVAHDLNNILMSLYGNVALARMEVADDHEAACFLDAAEMSMDRAKALSTRLLTFAKGGDPVTQHARIDRLVTETVRFHLSGSNVKPVFEVSEDLWPCDADPGQMHQVFSNLTVNADQAMGDGGRLFVRLGNIALLPGQVSGLPAGRYVQATLRDEGAGIDAATAERIFDPYFTTKDAGNGLGLAIVHAIVERHRGHISVHSEPGHGTAFTIFLPAVEGAPRPQMQPTPPPLPAPRRHVRVLIMDDDAEIRRVLGRLLDGRGIDTEAVADGALAVERYREAKREGRPFDLVITDLTVPGGQGGLETNEQLHAFDPQVRVVASSGYSDASLTNFRSLGFAGVLPKPYRVKDLDKLLEDVLPEQYARAS